MSIKPEMNRRTDLPHGAVWTRRDLAHWVNLRRKLPNNLHYIGFQNKIPFWFRSIKDDWVSIARAPFLNGKKSNSVLIFDNYFFALAYFELLKQRLERGELNETERA